MAKILTRMRAGEKMSDGREELRSLTPFRQGTVLLFTRSEHLAGIVAHAIEALGSNGPRLSTVHTFPDCLVALRLLGPSLVILDDATSPDGGTALLDGLHRERPGTPVIYVASHHTLELEREVRRRGVLFYVEMPESRELLDTALARLLGNFVREACCRDSSREASREQS